MTKITTKIVFSPQKDLRKNVLFIKSWYYKIASLFFAWILFNINRTRWHTFSFQNCISNIDSKYSCTISNHFFYLRFRISLYKSTQKHSRITCTEDVMKIKKKLRLQYSRFLKFVFGRTDFKNFLDKSWRFFFSFSTL